MTAEQIVPVYAMICELPTQAAGTDEKSVELVTEFYRASNNGPIAISHGLDILAMRIKGATEETLEQLTTMYRMTDKAESH